MSINAMPNELVSQVASCLSSNDLGSFAAVSTGCNALASYVFAREVPKRGQMLQVRKGICACLDSCYPYQTVRLTIFHKNLRVNVLFYKAFAVNVVKGFSDEDLWVPRRAYQIFGDIDDSFIERQAGEPDRGDSNFEFCRENAACGLATSLYVSGSSDVSSIFIDKVYKLAEEHVEKIEATHAYRVNVGAAVAGAMYAVSQIYFG